MFWDMELVSIKISYKKQQAIPGCNVVLLGLNLKTKEIVCDVYEPGLWSMPDFRIVSSNTLMYLIVHIVLKLPD